MPLDDATPPQFPSGGPVSPARMYDLIKQDVRGHVIEFAKDVTRCASVQSLATALRTMPPSDLPPLVLQDPAVHAVLEITGRQMGAVCHHFGPEKAEAAKAMLIAAIEDNFEKSKASAALAIGAIEQLRKILDPKGGGQ